MGNKILAYTVNALCIGFLFWKMAQAGSDKAITLFFFYYPVIVFLNVALWLSLKIFGGNQLAAFKQTSIAVLLLFLPLYFIATKM
ncbi:hypothetical protein [Ferruginibacter sp.]|nr:hypothetical protein [Ferruginibacter sp.]